MGSPSPSAPKPPRLGVFIGYVEDSFQRKIWRSLLREAHERGASAICFFGHGLGAPQPRDAAMNVAYRLAGPENLDALIVLSNTVGNFKGPEAVARLVADSRLPAVSIAFPLDGVPYVSIEGGDAMRDLVLHLARDHGRRRFALVTGPESHLDSRQRELAFREVLASEGLALDERLVFRGMFYKDSGAAAVRAFLASGAEMDALVCLNDYMAMGALDELRARGLSVPRDLSVTGFDDIDEAPCTCPPLTTVAQPFDLIGKAAVDMALAIARGEAPGARSLGCRFVARRSCGCPPESPLEAALAEGEPEDRPENSSADSSADESADGLEPRLAAIAADEGLSGMLRFMDGEIAADPRGADSRLQRALARLWAGAREKGLGGEEADIYGQSLAFASSAALRRQNEEKIRLVDRQAFMRALGTRLLGSFSLVALARAWEDCVEPLGFRRGFLVLFGRPWDPASQSPPGESRLVTAIPEPGIGVVERRFLTNSLLPPGTAADWGGSGWLIEPLTYQNEALGYVLVELGSEDASAYETLRVEMSTALKGTLLMEEVRDNERKLERLVEIRTDELREANRDLIKQIAERAALEREIQEVSNRTMQAIGQDIHDDLCQRLIGLSMLSAVLERNLASTGIASLESVREISALLDGVVERSRRFARTLYPPALDESGLVPALEDLVDSQRGNAAGASVSFQVEGECSLDDNSVALQLYRVAQEALANALRHSGSDLVILRLVGEGGILRLEVRDFGSGFVPDGLGRGMGMRIMRYRADSIGARLEVSALNPGICVSCAVPVREAGR
jgi:DNA-binding LacI/PurR family transcriptional regulator/signal transduction histidine kinase